ncbi:hypothetical protein K501DRAFT_275085 [Backusella circina FSU 941]|nr:hypothetical protein K501DRAFT_275085 [Backusella circina FSU 941]
MEEKDNKISALECENQELKMKNSHTEHGVNEKESRIMSLKTENQSFKLEKATLGHQIKEKDDKINSLENENRTYRTSSINQTQKLETLHHEKVTLEQLLKSKEDTIVLLNRENNLLSTANQGNQKGANEMVETLKSLLEAKSNELELNKSNMKFVLDKEKKRNKKLQREIEMLKQQQKQYSQPSIATSSSNTAVSGDNILSINTNGDDDDVNNDINYDTECGTEDSIDDSSEDGSNDDDINYDTPSESEDAHNDLNYDDYFFKFMKGTKTYILSSFVLMALIYEFTIYLAKNRIIQYDCMDFL